MRSYTILIHRDADSGMYLVDVPDLPGVVTEAIPEPSYDARSVAVAV